MKLQLFKGVLGRQEKKVILIGFCIYQKLFLEHNTNTESFDYILLVNLQYNISNKMSFEILSWQNQGQIQGPSSPSIDILRYTQK